jgi:DNA-binding transcriptional MerR regulator
MEEGQVFTPRAAARELDVSTASLRRYVLTYERVFERLEPDERGRLYPAHVLERLSAAKVMQTSGQAQSIEQALLMLRDGAPAPTLARVETSQALNLSEEARAALTAILRDELGAPIRQEMRQVLEVQHQDLVKRVEGLEWGQGEQVELMRRAVELATAEGERAEALHQALLHIAQGMAAMQSRLEALEQRELPEAAQVPPEPSSDMEELRKMNAHLLAELERRRLEGEQPKRRAWWRRLF